MRTVLGFVAAILASMPAGAAIADEIVTVKTREGVTQSFTLLAPDRPVASVILLPGGNGKPRWTS
ncbi:MAG: hypothetical protein EXR02_08505 [Rhodospirillales bacterium]|nr:hypothetical protein [Rhodospirillales bacterium]